MLFFWKSIFKINLTGGKRWWKRRTQDKCFFFIKSVLDWPKHVGYKTEQMKQKCFFLKHGFRCIMEKKNLHSHSGFLLLFLFMVFGFLIYIYTDVSYGQPGWVVKICGFKKKGSLWAVWLWPLSPHWSPGWIRLIWLARWVSPSSLPRPTLPCVSLPKLQAGSERTTFPDEGQDCSGVTCIGVAVLSCWNLPTSSQGPFVGECRVIKLPRLQTH